MGISTRRFIVNTAQHVATIRDRNAPYHCHAIEAAKLPTLDACASMSESEFDSAIAGLIYGVAQ